MSRKNDWLTLLLASALLPTMLSCGILPEDPKEGDDPDEKFDFIERNNSLKLKDAETPPPELVGEDPNETTREIKERADKLSESLETKESAGAVEPSPMYQEQPDFPGAQNSRYYEDFILLDADREVEVVMSFNSAPLIDVISAFADVLEFNFVADSDLKGVVTLNLNSTMKKRELWETFDRMLRLAGATARRNGDLLQVIGVGKFNRQSDLRVDNAGVGNSEIISWQLKNVTAKEAAAQLKPFLGNGGTVVEVSGPNVLLVSDESDNIVKLRSILEILDQGGRKMWPRAVIYCNSVKPSKVAAELAEVLPVLGLPVQLASDKNDTPGSVHLTGIDRLQLVVVSAATEEVIDEIRDWIGILDSADSAQQERVYVYKVANGKAEQLASALSVIFTTQGSTLTVDTSSGNDRTQQLSSQTARNTNTNTNTSSNSNTYSKLATNNDTNTTIDYESSIFNTPVRLFADGVYNRLVIRTTPRTYAMIKALLDRLDTVPAQILLQILIVEINLDDSNEFGVEFSMAGSGGNTSSILSSNYDNLANSATDTGGKFVIANPKNPDEKFAYVRALAGRNKIKVVSSPQLLVSSNTEAQIQIGNDVPIVTGSVTSSQSSGQITNSYTYRETGIIMTITPQVTSTNLIVLDVKQEVSEPVKNTITTATDTPVIQQRLLETSMTIANGLTMVMGGMIQEKMTDNLSSIPGLSDIPILGRLVGDTKQSMSRTEMLVLITGYIVDERSPVEEMVKRYNVAVKTLSKFEGAIADQHARDMEREAKLRAKREAAKTISGMDIVEDEVVGTEEAAAAGTDL